MKLKKSYQNSLNKLFIFRTDDNYLIESVLFKEDRLCVSSQVGCPVKCKFCASGKHGLFRNLNTEEIIFQYEILKDNYDIKGIAIAGIGEPSANHKNIIESINRFKKQNLKVTVTTTGFSVKGFKELLNSNHDGITLSIHSFFEETRKKIFGKKPPLKEILSVFEKHLNSLSKTQKKKYQIGYLLIEGINDTEKELKALAMFSSKYKLTTMLMMYNNIDFSPFNPISKEKYEECFKFLRKEGIRVTLSNRFRTNPLGGCGTLTVGKSDETLRI